MLSPNDEFADYETYNFVMTVERKTPDPTDADYARAGLKRGLALEAKLGTNPYKFGLIGSSDSHTGMSAVEGDRLRGEELPRRLPGDAQRAGGPRCGEGLGHGCGRLCRRLGDREHARKGIYEAFKRREVYASTGPRITLRFFAGYDFGAADLKAKDLAANGYRKGVPMGGDLKAHGEPQGSDLPGRGHEGPARRASRSRADREGLARRRTAARTSASTTSRSRAAAASARTGDARLLSAAPWISPRAQYRNDIGAAELHTVWRDPALRSRAARVLLRTSARDPDAALFAARLARARQALGGHRPAGDDPGARLRLADLVHAPVGGRDQPGTVEIPGFTRSATRRHTPAGGWGVCIWCRRARLDRCIGGPAAYAFTRPSSSCGPGRTLPSPLREPRCRHRSPSGTRCRPG